MFTDGLFEVRRGAGSERLGVDGLIAPAHASCSRSTPTATTSTGCSSWSQRMHGGPLDDDVAVLQLRSTAAP